MRRRKSVYYMTDSELIAYKRSLYRKKTFKRRLSALFMTICLIALSTVSYHSIRSSAHSGDELLFKYYTHIIVQQGETLWNIADEYIDYTQYKDKNAYIKEVQSINHLTDNSDIRTGQSLVVPYYSPEFIK